MRMHRINVKRMDEYLMAQKKKGDSDKVIMKLMQTLFETK